MKAVFDTNILIDFLNGSRKAKKELSLYGEKIISIITYIEVMAGAKDTAEAAILQAFLRTFTVRDLSAAIADRAIELRQQHRMKIPDAIIYATARDAGCNLVTRNTRDFPTAWPDVRQPYRAP